jgi:deoxyribodipyrimidine photo-lyase
MSNTVLFWHRRDLRINDNSGLFKALTSGFNVQPVFIFDKQILSNLAKDDQRVAFIYQEIQRLKQQYQSLGTDLLVLYGDPTHSIPDLCSQLACSHVFTNSDYEPYAFIRDNEIKIKLSSVNCAFIEAKDHVIFEKSEVTKDDGLPYTIYTPYANKWKKLLTEDQLIAFGSSEHTHQLRQANEFTSLISMEEMGFEAKIKTVFPSNLFPETIISNYHETRNFPALSGTSRLSIHLRFGTISIRSLAAYALKHNATYLNELIWRDFYQMIIFHFPKTINNAFKPLYDQINWERNEAHFQAWCEGKTGYPLVDAGMRELNETGFMHNRVRMVVASFLTKHLLLDWRLGEAYFAEKLLDFELASNVGGWQWASGSGCDAAPYFRVFNPTSQQEKFDPTFSYIKKWVPEFGTSSYPKPIIEHTFARERILARYKQALTSNV